MEIQQLSRSRFDFQQPVNDQELRFELARVLPHEKVVEVRELLAGLFNNTYCVKTLNNSYILKVAPHSSAAIFYNEQHLMQRERSISRMLQSLSPLVPQYISFFKIDERDAFLQEFIEGRLWHDEMCNLSGLENTALWKQLGIFAKKLHSIEGDSFGYPDPMTDFSGWSEFILNNVNGMIEDSHRLGVYCEEIEFYRRLLPEFFPVLDRCISPRLLHGDLWPRNVIIGKTGGDIQIKAVIDAERAFWGDPISDWVLLLYNVPAAFWSGYGSNLRDTRDAASIAVYKGMYFILNILESTRVHEKKEDSLSAAKQRLTVINNELMAYCD